MAKELAVVLNDGSLEAAVTTALAAQRYRVALVHAITEDPAVTRRRASFDSQAGHFAAVKNWTVPLVGLAPEAKAAEPSVAKDLIASLAPVALAMQAAVRWDAATIHLPTRTGPATDDLARGTEYLQIFNELLQIPCDRAGIEITAPLLELEPWQVVDLGFQVDAPFELSWSCHTPGPNPCTLCPGCQSRQAAFQRAAKLDPLAKR